MAGKKFRCWKHSTGKTGWIPSCKFTEGNAICLIRSELFLTPSVWHVNNFNGAQNEAKSAVAVNAESEWVRGPGPRVSLFSSVWILIVQRLYGGGSLTLYLIYANTLASIHPAQNPLVYVRSFALVLDVAGGAPLRCDLWPMIAHGAAFVLSGELWWTVFPQVAKWHDFLLRKREREHTVRRVPQIDVADAVVLCGVRELFATGCSADCFLPLNADVVFSHTSVLGTRLMMMMMMMMWFISC